MKQLKIIHVLDYHWDATPWGEAGEDDRVGAEDFPMRHARQEEEV